MTRQTTRDRIARYLKARPGRRVSVLTLSRIAVCRYRQDISDLRAAGMSITNVITWVKGQKHSAYIYEPESR